MRLLIAGFLVQVQTGEHRHQGRTCENASERAFRQQPFLARRQREDRKHMCPLRVGRYLDGAGFDVAAVRTDELERDGRGVRGLRSPLGTDFSVPPRTHWW